MRFSHSSMLIGCTLLLVCPTAAIAAEPAAAKVLADFQNLDAVKLTPLDTQTEFVERGGSRGLQITTAAESSWPSVLIQPPNGMWDLSGLDAVELDVTNPQEVPVRVLLSINNPGADGRKHCSTESVTVPPGMSRTLTVPFGMWHGSPGDPLDLSKIVSVAVLLDRPGRAHRFVVDNLRAVPFDRGDMKAVLASEFFQQLQPVLGRGVNLGNALEAPNEGEWGVKLEEGYFDAIQQAGFESVRIPVRWPAHAERTAPYRIAEPFFERVDWAVQQALKRRLLAVINIHHYDEIMRNPRSERERFIALWRQIAQRFENYPPALYFELLNEPHGDLQADVWNELLAAAIAEIRRTNPTRKIVVGPVGWNSPAELDTLVLPEDDRQLIVTFHYYSPFQFTHQGASWVGGQSQQWLGTPWSGTPAERQAVVRDFDRALQWSVAHRRPLYLGEFGAYNKADLESRARWTRFVADQAIQRKMGFAYWEFCSGFGVYDANSHRWVEPLKEALLRGKP